MRSKKSKRGLGKPEGAHEALMLVVLAPEVEEALHSDRAVGNHGAVPQEDVVEGEVLDGILLISFVQISIPNCCCYSDTDCDQFDHQTNHTISFVYRSVIHEDVTHIKLHRPTAEP